MLMVEWNLCTNADANKHHQPSRDFGHDIAVHLKRGIQPEHEQRLERKYEPATEAESTRWTTARILFVMGSGGCVYITPTWQSFT